MAGNTRGRLKELFESIHRNCDWQIRHCDEALSLIADFKPSLSEGVKVLATLAKQLDEFAQDLYSKI